MVQPTTNMRRASLHKARSPFLAMVFLAGLAASARADSPASILHEFIPPDPSDDVMRAATLDDGIPAAVQTPSGLATAPDPRRAPGADHVYGGGTVDDGPDSTYEPDRDTRRPNVESYDDPFSPATAPFKRLRAFDWVDTDYSFRVRDISLRALPVGGSVALGDEPFYGDLTVDLIPGEPVRIPTVGPGARVLRMHVNPEHRVELLRDGADNWFARGTERVRVRIVMELAIARDTFGRDFDDVDWGALDAIEAAAVKSSGVPTSHVHDAAIAEATQAIGVSRAQRPREVVRKMVSYFRAFGPSDVPPNGHKDIYLDLTLSKKGVCRHRAFGFLVTAIGLGVPARMVANEAHAWVEVFDGRLWHRIDLGGAAANLDHPPDPGRPAYVPPPDPYSWPGSRDGGQDLADRNRSQPGNGRPSGNGSQDNAAPTPGTYPATHGGDAPNATSNLPEAEISVSAVDGDTRRGAPLHIQGSVSSGGARCANVRVDIILANREKSTGSGRAEFLTVLGSLSTDGQGRFDGAVVIPRDVGLGEYDLVVQTPGDARCGAGRTH